ncbi:MAG: DinB family protein, partial [Armatimonadota bacterium]
MALEREEALADVQVARGFLNRHTAGMTTEQWDAKPFAHVNSVREIFGHLIATVRAVREMLLGEPFAMPRHVERHKVAAVEIATL